MKFVPSNYYNYKSYTATAADIEELEDQFIRMADRTLDIINEKVTVEKFKRRLINLNVRNREQHQKFLDAAIFSEKTAESVEDVWRKLSCNYWDFLNYTLLEHIIKKCDDQNLLAEMKAYIKNLEIFRCKTRLCDFAEHFKDIREHLSQKDLENFVVVKLKKNWQDFSLQDMENWKKCLTHTLLLPSFIPLLRSFGPGCVSITWAVHAIYTASLVEKLKTVNMTDFCSEHKIMSLIFNGVEYLGEPDPQTSASADLSKDTGQFYAVCCTHRHGLEPVPLLKGGWTWVRALMEYY